MKEPLLLLHGALGTKNQFDAIIPYLEEHFSIFKFNFEGHGDMESDSNFSISLFTKNTLDFIKVNQIENPYIFGYSMGGYVAINLAINRLVNIKRIVTLGTKFNWTPDSAAREVKMLNPNVIEEKVPHFARKLKEDHFPSDWKKVMNRTAQMMLDLGNGKALAQGDIMKLENKVILGIGSEDSMVSVEETKEVQKWLPNAQFKSLEGAPHPIEKCNPELIAQYVINSLA